MGCIKGLVCLGCLRNTCKKAIPDLLSILSSHALGHRSRDHTKSLIFFGRPRSEAARPIGRGLNMLDCKGEGEGEERIDSVFVFFLFLFQDSIKMEITGRELGMPYRGKGINYEDR
ncbi:hypothetical protein V6N11_014025 [Hibiscus sabdariffa]|uniref:Uncharacterized protein n=1 Tax=Hibiscus sabdariffa TaxID=183260 RepID=A0ABR2AFC9_9ROSI